jgi:hypothetical protein
MVRAGAIPMGVGAMTVRTRSVFISSDTASGRCQVRKFLTMTR